MLTLQYKCYRSRNKPGSSGFLPGRQNCTEMHQRSTELLNWELVQNTAASL